MASDKLLLPAFIKVLTNGNLTPTKAITIAGKIYKKHGAPDALALLTDAALAESGVREKEDRRLVLAAVRKAGYKAASASPRKRPATSAEGADRTNESPAASPRKRRRRNDDLNEFLPDKPRDEGVQEGSLEFDEITDENVIKDTFAVVNRAPVMTAWATVVAERMGFTREEALSIATVYTELNAVAKGVSKGIYEKGKGKGLEAQRDGAQPFIELMGRRPLFKTQTDQWRALSSGAPVSPTTAHSYIKRSLRQTTPHIIGALRLLAASYSPEALNQRGFSLYADFRPEVKEWGERGRLECERVLALRKAPGTSDKGGQGKDIKPVVPQIKVEDRDNTMSQDDAKQNVDEYDAALNDDPLSAEDLAALAEMP